MSSSVLREEGAHGGAEYAYRCGSALVRVHVQGAPAQAALSSVFPDYRIEGYTPGVPDLELHTAPSGGWLLRAFGAQDPTPDGTTLSDVFGRMERLLADLLALGNRPALLIHAGGALIGGHAVVLAGPSGSGKSSVSAALGVAGCPVLGDDAVVLTRGGEVRPFHRLFKLHTGAQEALALTQPDGPLEALFPDASFYHPGDLDTQWAPPAPLHHVVFVHRNAQPNNWSPMTAAEGIRRLLDLALGPDDKATSLAALVEATQHVSFSSLGFDRCDFAAAELIRRFG